MITQQSPFMKSSEQRTESGPEFMVSKSEQFTFPGSSGSAGRLPFVLNCVSKNEEDGLAITQLGHCINYSESSVKAVSKGLLYKNSNVNIQNSNVNDQAACRRRRERNIRNVWTGKQRFFLKFVPLMVFQMKKLLIYFLVKKPQAFLVCLQI